ncbi:NADH dehydrogenase (quinone) [Handroanthus impetiginosus]|uniref:NADH dehydrogenase (Quinone) n=1 Tax=Handroanthus impetiginosus TaxID=429701 RepID=A0A2G9FVN7_9LAMI|nr:NADH dehydrogenase (quinone) [Handroanthus impetiginosus]
MSEQYRIIEYSLIILFVLIGGVFLMSSSDLISIFLSLELQSYALYILCVIYRDSERATSGGLTYFLLGGLSSCFILLAFGLLYGNSGNTGYDGLYTITNISSVKDNVVNSLESLLASLYQSYYLNFSLTIIPDVYDAIPTIVTTFVAVFAKISILVLLLELVHFTTNYFSPYADLVNNQENSFFNFS